MLSSLESSPLIKERSNYQYDFLSTTTDSFNSTNISNGDVGYTTNNNDKKRLYNKILIGVCAVAVATATVCWSTMKSQSDTTTQSSLSSSSNFAISRDIWDEKYNSWEKSIFENGSMMSMAGTAGANEYVTLLSQSSPSSKVNVNDDNDGEPILKDLLYFNNTDAFGMLRVDDDFYYYQQGWEAQITQAHCPIAASAAVLNSYRGLITLPQDPKYIPFPWATQTQIQYNDCVRSTIFDVTQLQGFFGGLGLDMAKDFLNCQFDDLEANFIAESYRVDPSKNTIEEIRSTIKDALQEKESRVIINYDRGGIGQGPMGHGHFSPIGSYDAEMDAFLIMDVAKYKYPPVWVSSARLFGGIASLDYCATPTYPKLHLDDDDLSPSSTTPLNFETFSRNCEAEYRGFIVVKPVG